MTSPEPIYLFANGTAHVVEFTTVAHDAADVEAVDALITLLGDESGTQPHVERAVTDDGTYLRVLMPVHLDVSVSMAAVVTALRLWLARDDSRVVSIRHTGGEADTVVRAALSTVDLVSLQRTLARAGSVRPS